MADLKGPRATQAIQLSTLVATTPADKEQLIVRMIEHGEEPRRIFSTIVEAACEISGVTGCAIFLPSERSNSELDLIASFGAEVVDPKIDDEKNRAERLARQGITSSVTKIGAVSHFYLDVVCLGAPIGVLAAVVPDGMPPKAFEKLNVLTHHTSVVYERQKLSSTLQHFLDRVQVLNELNQLIASNVNLQRITKSLAREAAFRFAADVAFTFLLDEEKKTLHLKGGYGCTPASVPAIIELRSGIFAQVMRVGGHLSITNLATQSNHGLNFLEDLGVKSVDVCCLEVRGESLGAILIGYRRETTISQNDHIRFDEFCQGAAVAIANARTQERITAYTERLEELVESRTADLAIQSAKAEEANRAKSQFLANMSHELRTPLTAIVGYSSVLSDGVFGPLNDKQADALQAVTRSSDHLKNLIDDVLNLARIESGKENPEPARVPVKDLLTQTHKLMLQTAIGKGVNMQSVIIPDELQNIHLYADVKHVHQIIINMIGNAVKYTPKEGKVWVEASIAGDKVKISVSDTGVGIPPNKLEKLFERFERGEDAYSKSQEGTGIGLNLTRRLVELNGGRIGVESTVGKGSTFWILMPLASDEAKVAVIPERTDVKVRLDGLSALIVDDSSDTLEVLKTILIAAGATVRTASNVQEGRDALGEHVPDVVLTDLAMPGESGLSLINHIRNNQSDSLPIIVLSACAFDSDKQNALDAGANVFLPKPFKPAEVVNSVRQLTLNLALQG